MTPVELGRKLRTLRESAEMTQDQAAATLKKSRNHIGSIERGVVIPRFDEVVKLLQLFNSSLRKFFSSSVPDRYAQPHHAEVHRKVQELLEASPDREYTTTTIINALHAQLTNRKNSSLHPQ